ncbi:HIT family protein [archaeon]|nr:HIT family protein [archaeon]
MDNCIFCKIIKGEIPCEKIYEDEYTLAFLDIMPVNEGHTLVIPKKHSEQLILNHDGDLHHVMDTIRKVVPIILKAVKADGWNLGVNNGKAAGQAVFHTHFHLIQRFANDGLKHWPHKNSTPEERTKLAEKIQQVLK